MDAAAESFDRRAPYKWNRLDHRAQNWQVRKPSRGASRRGIVASQHSSPPKSAPECSARRQRGRCRGARRLRARRRRAWNSGLGESGYMLVYIAKEDRVEVVDFGPFSRALIPPLSP